MFWTQGAKVSQESFAPPKPCFAPVQLSFAPVQEAFRTLGPKDLLHPLLTTLGAFEVSGPCSRTFGSQLKGRELNTNTCFCPTFSGISKISKFSRISRKWLDSPLFSTVSGFSKVSRISKFSRISRKWTILKRPLFQKTPFSEPEFEYLGTKIEHKLFFLKLLGAPWISRQNPGISRQKSLIPWVSRDIPNFLAPTPSRGRPPPHQKISGLKSLGLGSFFVPDFLFYNTEYDRAKVPPYNGNDPRPPLVV